MPSAIRLPLCLRYGLVSGTCFVSNNLILVVADRLGLPLLAGVSLGFLLVGTAGFHLHCRFTFVVAPTRLGLARYLLVMAANTPLSIALLWMCSVLLEWPMVIAAPVASAGMVVANFLTSRLAIQAGRARSAVPGCGGRQSC